MVGPADALQLIQADVASPYLDTATETVVYYVTTNNGAFQDTDTGIDQVNQELLKFQRLHINNPAWAATVDASPIIDQGILDGVSNFGVPALADVFIEITNVPDYVDFWWGTDEFAKFGLLYFGAAGVPENHPLFINELTQGFVSFSSTNDFFKIILQKGVTAQIQAGEFFNPGPILYDLGGGFTAFLPEDPTFAYSLS